MARVGSLTALTLCVLFIPFMVGYAANAAPAGLSSQEILANSLANPTVSGKATSANAAALPVVNGGPRRDRASEPDDAGYVWRDNDENNGPRFEWLNVADYQNVREFRMGDDQNTGAIDLGFVFPFWGREFRQVYLDTDGWLSFTYGGTPFRLPVQQWPMQVGQGAGYDATVCWTSMDFTAGTEVWYWTNNQNRAIVWWAGNHSEQAQMILEANGKVTIQYGANCQDRPGGVNMGDGRHGWYWPGGNGYFANGRAIAFGPRGAWIQFDGPGIQVEPAELAFGEVYLNFDRTIEVDVTNVGAEELTITAVDCQEGAFVLPQLDQDVILASGETASVPVTFRPGQVGDYAADIQISCNADNADNGIFTVHATGRGATPPEVELDPQGFEEEVNSGEQLNRNLTIFNRGGGDLTFDTELEIVSEGAGRDASGREIRSLDRTPVGPRRDEINIDGMRFAFFETSIIWNRGLYQGFMDVAPLLDENNCTLFSNGDDWNNVNFEDYDVVIVNAYNQPWDQIYQNNLARFEEYVAGGGAAYFETANSEDGVRSPGGIWNDNWSGDQNGVLVVSPDRNAENYSLLADIFHEAQPDYWNDGEVIEGNSFLHATYNEQQFIDRLNDGTIEWYQIQAVGQNNRLPGAVSYGFGRGTVMTVGHPVGYGLANWRGDGNWHSMPAEILYYLTEASGAAWLSYEPTEGTIAAGENAVLAITLGGEGLLGGQYEAILRINSNDPQTPVAEVNIRLWVIGIPNIVVEWPAAIGFPDEIDWNAAYPDLFTGHPYDIVVPVSNDGTAQLDVGAISCETGQFTAAPMNFTILPGEKVDVTLTLATDADDLYEGSMIFESNDPDGDLSIFVRGETGSPPVIRIDPGSIDEELFTGGSVQREVRVYNDGGSPLRFTMDANIIAEGRDADARSIRSLDASVGPRRDDAGDQLGEIQWEHATQWNFKGFAYDYDNDLMLFTAYSPQWMGIIDPANDYQVVRQWQPNINPMGAAWLDGIFYTVNWWSQVLGRWDVDGNDLGALNCNNRVPTAITASQDLGVLFMLDDNNNRDLFVLNPAGDELARISRNDYQQFQQGNWSRSICWVDKHPDGQLWMNTPGHIWQLSVDVENWRINGLVEDWGVNGNSLQEWDGIGHDKENLLYGTYGDAGIRIYDDGVTEMYWLAYAPEEGTVAVGEFASITVTLNAAGLNAGNYQADVLFYSNDPSNEGVAACNVTLTVTGAPDIAVEWADEAGFPEGIDFNLVYPDLFCEGVYTVPMTVTNEGSDDLSIGGIWADNDYVTIAPESPVLNPRESVEVTITYSPPAGAPEDYSGTITIPSNDPDEENYTIPLHAHAFLPPVIIVDPQMIEDELFTGQTSDHNVRITNDGDAPLRWSTDIEILDNNRDQDARSIRSLDRTPNGPRRDEPVDLGDLRFAVFETNNGWNNGMYQGFLNCENRLNQDNLASFRNNADWNDVDFSDYDVICVNSYSQPWAQEYANNLERFEEYIADGGAAYFEMANTENGRIPCPGGVFNDLWNGYGNGTLVVSPDPQAENYSLLAELAHAAQPDNWNEGELIEGSSFLHSTFSRQQFQDRVDNGAFEWYQVIAVGQGSQDAGVVAYGMGRGTVMAVGHPVGYGEVNFRNVGNWHSIVGEILFYLTEASGAKWISVAPEEGVLENGAFADVTVHLDAAGLVTDRYEALLHVLSNDVNTPDVEVQVILDATGAPDIDVTWAEELGFPQEMNWNSAPPFGYGDQLFFGGDYPLDLNIANIGTDTLVISNLSVEGEAFTTNWDPNNQNVVQVGDDFTIQVIFNAPAADDWEGTIVIESNGNGDEGDINIFVHGTAASPPIITLSREEIIEDVVTGDVRTYDVEIGNDGQAPLIYSVDIVAQEPQDRDGAASRGIRSLVGAAPVRDRRGEPDDLDYEWRDNDENDGPVFEWIDIREAEGVRNFVLGDDQNTGRIDLGFDFPLYDRVQNFIYVDSDGWISMVNQSQQIGMPAFPSGDQNTYYTFTVANGDWAGDWNGAGPLYFWTNNRDQAVVTYYQWDDRGNGSHADFQVIFNANGMVTMQYGDRFGDGNRFARDCHVGFNGGDGQHGMEIVPQGQGAGYLVPGRAIAFGPSSAFVSWVAFEPMDGNIAVGGSEMGLVTLNAAGLLGGQYTANINFISNDPIQPGEGADATIAITMNVTGVANIDVTPGGPEEGEDPVPMGIGYFGYPVPYAVEVANVGTDDLTLTDVVLDQGNTDFYVNLDDLDNFILAAGEARNLNIWYNSTEANGAGDKSATLLFTTNDPRYADGYPVRVAGMALPRPILVIDPNGISREIDEGNTDDVMVNLANEGGSVLIWEAEIETIFEPQEGRDADARSIRSLDNTPVGPRRDEVNLDGMRFAWFQQNNIWGWLYDGMVGNDPLLDQNNCVWYQNGDDWNNVDFSEFDAICIGAYSQPWNAQYQNNLARLEEYVDGGGALYYETANNNPDVRSPGGIYNDRWESSSNGILVVSPDPAAENYSLFADICHESQPDFWNEGEVIEGSAWLHGGYGEQQFIDGVANGTLEWYQVIATQQDNQGVPGAVAYGFGSGTVLTVAHPVGHCWQWFNQDGMWGSIASEILYYLTEAGGAKWISMEPMDGTLDVGGNTDVMVSLNGLDVLGGDYQADIHFFSNDPADPDQVLTVNLTVNGRSVLAIDPPPVPFVDQAVINFPRTYVGAENPIPVTFSNVGSQVYTISNLTLDGDNPNDFATDLQGELEVPARGDRVVNFFFRPTDVGDRSARIHLVCNAMNVEGQEVYWDLTGFGMLPPIIYTRPEANVPMQFVQPNGASVNAMLVIGNEAGQNRDDLVVSIGSRLQEDRRDAANGRSIRLLERAANDRAPVENHQQFVGNPASTRTTLPVVETPAQRVARADIGRDEPNDLNVLIFNDGSGWGGANSALEGAVMAGVPEGQIRQVGSGEAANIDLEPYNVIVWVDGHGTEYYANYSNNRARFEEWVAAGGILIGNNGSYNIGNPVWSLPGDVTYVDANGQSRMIREDGCDLENPIIAGDPNDAEDNLRDFIDGSDCGAGDWNRDDFLNNGNIDNQQIFFHNEADANLLTVVTYDYGRGHVLGHSVFNSAHWYWWNQGWDANWERWFARNQMLWAAGVDSGLEWLTINPEEGSIAAGQEAEITLTFSPLDLPEGDYFGELVIESNDINIPVLVLGVSMNIGDGPRLRHFTDFRETLDNHSVQVTAVTVEDNPAATGWEVGVFTPNDVLAGAGIWIEGQELGISVWGMDPDIAPNQFNAGERMSFKVWDDQADVQYDVLATLADVQDNGDLNWVNGGYTVLSLAYNRDYTCVVPFQAGWNLISINITPPQDLWNANGPDIRLMMAQLRVDANHHHVILMKNERGNFYAPANNNFNNIPFWNTAEAYQVRIDQAMEGRFTGIQIDAQADVPIAAGWNMIAYFPTYRLSCTRPDFIAISPIIDYVVLVKDGFGHFASVRNNFSNMDDWREARGYQINVSQACVLNYPQEQQAAAAIKVGESDASVVGRWAEPAATGANMSVLVTGIKGVELASDDQVAAFSADGRLVGVGRVTEGMVGLAVWGDDASTEAVDGLQSGEAFMLKLWDADKEAVVDLRMEGLVYETDAFTAADAVAGAVIPNVFSLGQNFPNPFNAVTRIAFGLPEASRISIRVFDVAGREVATLASGNLEAGNHTAVWSAEGFNSGVYLVKMETPAFNATRKVTLVK